MNPLLIASLAVGAGVAAGVMLVVRELLPAAPALGAALDRLHPPGLAPGATRSRSPRVPVPHRDLALLGRTPGEYGAALAAGAAGGAALPPVVSAMTVAAGRLDLSVALVAGAAVATAASAGAGALVVHLEVGTRARRLRRQFRPVIATYLSLVAMERAAGHGSVESLERAAQVGDGPAVRRIREALHRARAHHRPPWQELQDVATALGVPELGDVGQIMHSSGLAGAQVHRTLLQRAQSLRDQIRTDALAEAEQTTTKLDVPGVLLLVLLVAYFLYPFLQQIDL